MTLYVHEPQLHKNLSKSWLWCRQHKYTTSECMCEIRIWVSLRQCPLRWVLCVSRWFCWSAAALGPACSSHPWVPLSASCGHQTSWHRTGKQLCGLWQQQCSVSHLTHKQWTPWKVSNVMFFLLLSIQNTTRTHVLHNTQYTWTEVLCCIPPACQSLPLYTYPIDMTHNTQTHTYTWPSAAKPLHCSYSCCVLPVWSSPPLCMHRKDTRHHRKTYPQTNAHNLLGQNLFAGHDLPYFCMPQSPYYMYTSPSLPYTPLTPPPNHNIHPQHTHTYHRHTQSTWAKSSRCAAAVFFPQVKVDTLHAKGCQQTDMCCCCILPRSQSWHSTCKGLPADRHAQAWFFFLPSWKSRTSLQIHLSWNSSRLKNITLADKTQRHKTQQKFKTCPNKISQCWTGSSIIFALPEFPCTPDNWNTSIFTCPYNTLHMHTSPSPPPPPPLFWSAFSPSTLTHAQTHKTYLGRASLLDM